MHLAGIDHFILGKELSCWLPEARTSLVDVQTSCKLIFSTSGTNICSSSKLNKKKKQVGETGEQS